MRRMASAIALTAMLSACATGPEPCTPEWVEWKSETVLKRFAISNYREVSRLRDFSKTLQQDEISPLVALQIPGMIEDFKDLANRFEDSALPELNAAAAQCGSAQELVPAFISFLRDEGVEEDVLEWVTVLSAFVVDS